MAGPRRPGPPTRRADVPAPRRSPLMDYSDMIRAHLDKGADLTVGCIPAAARESIHFGVVQVDGSERITGFQEKPKDPVTIPGDPNYILASMGIYIFTVRLMYELLCQDATKQ